MRQVLPMAAIAAALLHSTQAFSDSETDLAKQQLNALKKEYEIAIESLEERLLKTQQNGASPTANTRQNSFNPAISLILDGRFATFDNDPEGYELPGFALGNEAGLGAEGFSVGHSELVMSANIDNRFYGQMTLAFAEHDGATETELEEAFIQTVGLGNGFTVRAGRFFSSIGYLNQQHSHMWDFADAPLIYRGLFGNQLIDDGLQLTWLASTDTFMQLGAELTSGSRFPAAGTTSGVGAWTVFAEIGGDFGTEHSWQLGLSHWQADDIEDRSSSGHGHGGGSAEIPSFTGDSKISGLNAVYKWAPNGNPKNQNLKLQFEYFDRSEDGEVVMLNSGPPVESTGYQGDQKGWYAHAIYRFQPSWQAGVRYGELESDNRGTDSDVIEEAGLDNEGHTPRRYSAMIEWIPSEFSRVRLQYNRDESYEHADEQVILQYTMSLGSHGAHQF